MNSIKLLQSRAVIATMLLFSFLVLEENGPARGDNTGSVDVTANVTDSTPGPECEDTAGPVTFEPRLGTDENLSIDLNDILEDSVMLDFGITPGETEDCAAIEGYVKFSQTGFQTNGTPVNWLTTTFDCEFGDNLLTADEQGVFTCSGTNGVSPTNSVITVTADAANAEAVGIVTNTLSISLFAND